MVDERLRASGSIHRGVRILSTGYTKDHEMESIRLMNEGKMKHEQNKVLEEEEGREV
jgi:hypothetical protein